MKQTLMIMFTVILASCQLKPDPQADTINTLIDREGSIGVIVCSRGCYQYVLSTPTIDGGLFPINLHKTLEKAAFDYYVANQNQGVTGYPVVFSGILKSDSTVFSVPAPNDVPTPNFKARNIELTAIRKR